MTEEIKRICVVDTVYTLFLYYLICGVNENDIFILSSGIPISIRKNINHIYFPPFKYKNYSDTSKITKIKERLSNILHRYHIVKLRLILLTKIKKNDVEVYGHGHLKFSFPIYEYEKSYLIEDGLSNYSDLKEPAYTDNIFSKILKFIGVNGMVYNECFGTHKNIKKIYLTQNEVPEIIKDKTDVIDIKKLWMSKSEDEKNKILEIYNLKDTINQIEDNSTLLLTQCISEDSFLPLKQEISIYKELIEKQENKNIIIKTHPRERKKYKEIFPEFVVINQPFPLEILKCMDINIKKIITVSSTAALNFVDECEIELYEKETSSKEINDAIHALKKQLFLKSNEN